SGTLPVPLCVGIGAAATLCRGESADEERMSLRERTQDFVSALEELKWPISVNGPPIEVRHPGNASIEFKGFDAKEILGTLQPNLAASTGSACTSGIEEPSHVLTAIGLTREQADASIRFSLGRDTTQRNLQDAVVLIDNALENLYGV
ncbi:MAG: aminotransferase class V-fold PLP-dependent enzyme, partial [Gammaproteobacteria bacterium]|nr:aminotransferase class V-fold PLP-dependent enzyme [Gammaproteobacteria bacterium]